MIIHCAIPKQKPKKKSAKQKQMEADAKRMAAERKAFLNSSRETYTPKKTYVRETPHIPSLKSEFYDCSKKDKPTYTGTRLIGIATMHKSNAVPIFSEEDAIEVSRMRRG